MGAQNTKERTITSGTHSIRATKSRPKPTKDGRQIVSNIFTEHSGMYALHESFARMRKLIEGFLLLICVVLLYAKQLTIVFGILLCTAAICEQTIQIGIDYQRDCIVDSRRMLVAIFSTLIRAILINEPFHVFALCICCVCLHQQQTSTL